MTSKNPKMSKNQNSATFKLFEFDQRRYFNTYNLLLVSESKYYMLEVQVDREFPAKTPNKTILISNIEMILSQNTRNKQLSAKQGLMISFVKD